MDRQLHHLHFVLVPFLAHGHFIPMVDMGRQLARHGVTITIVATPLYATRFGHVIDRDSNSGLPIQILQVPFPSAKAGLPEGCESMELVPSRDLVKSMLDAISMLQEPLELMFHELDPPISCIIGDKFNAWISSTALKFHVPWLVFDGTSCFSLLSTHNILASKVHETVSESEPFVVPGLPDRIVLTRSQLPNAVVGTDIRDARKKIKDAADSAYGVVVNTWEELEPAYVQEYRKVRGERVWCIGPVSMCNKDELDKGKRGDKAAIGEEECLRWLNLQEPSSVVYACLGSLSRLQPIQLKELGLALEAANRPFIWVIRGKTISEEMDKWFLEEGFEERTKGRSLIIRGWAPQMLILSHPAVGSFLTHCGWNSTLEGISAGLPMITWPLFADQFYNEKFIVQVLGIGVRVGAEFSVRWGEEDKFGVTVKREDVKTAIDEVMGGGEEARRRRTQAQELGKMASKAVEEGGSSWINMDLLIQDIKEKISSQVME